MQCLRSKYVVYEGVIWVTICYAKNLSSFVWEGLIGTLLVGAVFLLLPFFVTVLDECGW